MDNVEGRYTDLASIQSAFGAKNLAEWLNTNDDEVEGAPTAEQSLAAFIEAAESYIDDRLRCVGAPFEVLHPTIHRIASLIAGVYAYEKRGVINWDPMTGKAQHRLQFQRDEAERIMNDIVSGKLRLEGSAIVAYPKVVD